MEVQHIHSTAGHGSNRVCVVQAAGRGNGPMRAILRLYRVGYATHGIIAWPDSPPLPLGWPLYCCNGWVLSHTSASRAPRYDGLHFMNAMLQGTS